VQGGDGDTAARGDLTDGEFGGVRGWFEHRPIVSA
jgi:hypothetical protein